MNWIKQIFFGNIHSSEDVKKLITKEDVKNGVLCKKIEDEACKEITNTFTLEGRVCVYIVFAWDDLQESRGTQNVCFQWYTGKKLVAQYPLSIHFGGSPWYIWGDIPSLLLGVGEHSVKAFVEDELVFHKYFEVKENSNYK